jgi:hypothetical protein
MEVNPDPGIRESDRATSVPSIFKSPYGIEGEAKNDPN